MFGSRDESFRLPVCWTSQRLRGWSTSVGIRHSESHFRSSVSTNPNGRVLINLKAVGGLGSRADDVLVLGDCDAGVRKLAGMLGWLEELEELWKKTQPERPEAEAEESSKSEDQVVEEEVERLAAEIDRSLTMSKDYDHRVRSQLMEDDRLRN